MRVLIMSDTHGREDNLVKVIQKEGMPDFAIHLGDSEGGEEHMRQLLTCPLEIVAGNCDYFTKLPVTKIVTVDGCRILITHGHHYFVSVGIRDLMEDAKANDCRMAMFGHTHKPYLYDKDPELTVLNPGSLSFPRQEGRKPGYVLMEIQNGEPVDIQQKFLRK